MDELNRLGGMTPAHMVLITELVAVCLAARPQPRDGCDVTVTSPASQATSAERTKRWRERKKGLQGCDGVTSHVTEKAIINNNINNSLSGKGGVGGKPIVTPVTSHGTRLPDPWDPPENLWEKAKNELRISDADLRFETKAFRDHFWSAPGVKGRKVHWDKTWMNWMRNNKRWSKKPKDNVVSFVSSGAKRTWAEQQAEKGKK
jgi:hypothetical protein